MKRRTLVSGAAAGIAVMGTGWPGAAQTPQASPVGDTREITHPRGVTTIPVNPQRVLALGEEFMLADLLELGVKPAMSSGKFLDRFVGIDPALTEGLTPFSIYEADLEAFSVLQPDLILVPDTYIDYAPDMFDLIGQIGPLVTVPLTSSWQDDFRFLASIFGLDALADVKVAEIEALIETTSADLGVTGQTVSYATVYEDAADVAVWFTDQHQMPNVGMALGLVVEPDAEGYDLDPNGRASISMEDVGMLTGDTLIMLQLTAEQSAAEGERWTTVQSEPIWQTIPAVQADRVFVIERIGYPGDVPGRRGLLERYREIFA